MVCSRAGEEPYNQGLIGLYYVATSFFGLFRYSALALEIKGVFNFDAAFACPWQDKAPLFTEEELKKSDENLIWHMNVKRPAFCISQSLELCSEKFRVELFFVLSQSRKIQSKLENVNM